MVEPAEQDDPRQIGPYVVLGRLGAGGMGQVYLGRAPDGQQCAVKVIHPGLAQDEQFRARFGREVATARQVRGPHLARVLGADLDGPLPWLATEYVPGSSLDEAVAARGPLAEQAVRVMAAQLFGALAAVHAAGVVHRDIKPSNILLGAGGATLIDFGIARAADSTRITRTGMVVGSPAFMSPEQAAGGGVGPASDVYSLAAALVFASTGVGPFGEGSPAALLLRSADNACQLDAVPGAVRPLVELCLATDPATRPTAAFLAATLGAAPAPDAGRGTPSAVARSPIRKAGVRWRPPRWLVVACAAVVIASVGTVVAVRSTVGAAPPVIAPAPGPAVGRPVTLTFPDDVRDVAFSPDSARAYVVHGDGLDVVDTATDTVSTRVALDSPYVMAVSPDGSRAYVGLGSGYVQVIDTATFRSLNAIRVGAFFVDIRISPDGRRAYAATKSLGKPVTVVVLDLTTNAVVRTLPIGSDGPVALALSGDGSQVFAMTKDEVLAITDSADSVSFRKTTLFPIIAPGPGSRIYLGIGSGGPVTMLDGSGDATALPALGQRRQIDGMAGTADGQHLYLLSRSSVGRLLEVFDSMSGTIAPSVTLGPLVGSLGEMRVSPDGRQVYLLDFISPKLEVLDIADYA